ncbi:MAG: hypothetical protein K2X41_04520 [Hyphomicrobium sp.]|nr:hypothetical protein [Hyphomicrobium sp.]
MQTHADPRTAIVAPAVISAALDCLAVLTDIDPIRPSHMHLIAKALGCREPEAIALTLRLQATAHVLNDPRWPAWSRFYKAAAIDVRRQFDGRLVLLIAELELDAACRFPADRFFAALLDECAPD